MTPPFPSVTLVVPVLNEMDGVGDVLEGLLAQEVPPQEVIFIDAGSRDGTVATIEAWATRHPALGVRVILQPGALPGAGRNRGVREARYDWIAFMDAGLIPRPDWLKALLTHAGPQGSWGSCLYQGQGDIGILAGAYSLGQGSTVDYFLASSLFPKTVFAELGFFREDLRAAEDLLWREAYFRAYGKITSNRSALVTYRRFPTTVAAVYRKWRLYADHTAFAGAQNMQRLAYTCFFFALAFAVIYGHVGLALGLLLAHFCVRGIYDPIRRSRAKPWWGNRIHLVVLGPLFVLGLDAAKMVGFLRGHWRAKIAPAAR